MTDLNIAKVVPWLEDETSLYETSNINLCANKGCGFNTDNVCSSTGTVCYGYMEEI